MCGIIVVILMRCDGDIRSVIIITLSFSYKVYCIDRNISHRWVGQEQQNGARCRMLPASLVGLTGVVYKGKWGGRPVLYLAKNGIRKGGRERQRQVTRRRELVS